MIAREWKAKLPKEFTESFLPYLSETGIQEAQKLNGFKGYQVFTRAVENGFDEVTLITFWQNLDSLREFSGPDEQQARLYPEDHQFQLQSDLTVTHYDVVDFQM